VVAVKAGVDEEGTEDEEGDSAPILIQRKSLHVFEQTLISFDLILDSWLQEIPTNLFWHPVLVTDEAKDASEAKEAGEVVAVDPCHLFVLQMF